MKEMPKILVIGDVMLDVYIRGTVRRISPESTCPVLEDCETPRMSLGGAANVARQLSASAFSVYLCGGIGTDAEGARIQALMAEADIRSRLVAGPDIRTTVKTRYLTADNRQLLRVDRDCSYAPSRPDYAEALQELEDGNYGAVVLSDYNKGFLCEDLCQTVIALCRQRGIPVVVDIKTSCDKYRGATVVKGNRREMERLCASLGIADERLCDRLQHVCHRLQCDHAVMTDGGDGIRGYSRKGGYVSVSAPHVPIFDVTGAGDVVTAFIAMLLHEGDLTLKEILEYANRAAGKKISQTGTPLITLDEIRHQSKRISLPDFAASRKGRKVVFTNGCFDVIHAGHVSLLNRARQLGDLLVVAINSDESVRRLKGETRPVNRIEDRIAVLSAISCVDRILVFEEDTPLNLIKAIRPDVLVKGGDYQVDEIVGADVVRSYGGEVCTLPLHGRLSTTNILTRLCHE